MTDSWAIWTRHRAEAWRGFKGGLSSGAVLIAVMYLLGPLTSFKALPQLLQQPILNAMPGFVFGFLIDRLQHLGKVLEELSLILTMLALLGILGSFYGVFRGRWPHLPIHLAIAAAAWLVVTIGVLPAGGEGWLGLNDGPTVPIIWAILLLGYSLILRAACTNWITANESPADPSRRRVLSFLPLGLGAIGIGVTATYLVPGWLKSVVSPPESLAAGRPPALTPASQFYVVSKNFQDPVVSAAGWKLQIKGLVDIPQALSLESLLSLPSRSETVTLECISNNVGGSLLSTGRFGGIALSDLVAMASPKATATAVAFTARDGFTESLDLSTVMADPTILVAYSLDDAPLPDAHGFPARMIIPGRYGMKGPKWLDSIELTVGTQGGYWEGQGWDGTVSVHTTSRFDLPHDGDLIPLGPIALGGVAFAGTRGISAVEYSVDGRTWTDATLDTPLSAQSWVLWNATWNPLQAGSYTLRVRARDGAGAVQTGASAPSFPNGATGYHSIGISVTT